MIIDRMEQAGGDVSGWLGRFFRAVKPYLATLVLIFWAAEVWYNSKEAHRHSHEAVNACSGAPAFGPEGRRQ